MPLYVLCPECKTTLIVGDKFAGQQVRCPKCQTVTVANPPVAAVPVFTGPTLQTGVAAASSPEPPPAPGTAAASPAPELPGQPNVATAPPPGKKKWSRGCLIAAVAVFLLFLLGFPYVVTISVLIYAFSGKDSPVAEVARQREQAEEAVQTLKEIRELFKESKELVKEVKELQKELDALDPNNPMKPGDERRADAGKAKDKLAKMEVFKNLQKQMEELNDIDIDDPESFLRGPAPVKITSSPPGEALTGQEFTYKVVARARNGGTLTYGLVNGPPGMKIGPDGVLKWNPPADKAGQYVHVMVSVKDSTGAEKRQPFNIIVRSGK